MSLNLVAHEWNSNSGMSSLFSEPPATLYLSLSLSISLSLSLSLSSGATLLHLPLIASLSQLRLRPINIAARGQTPGDQGGRGPSDHHHKLGKNEGKKNP